MKVVYVTAGENGLHGLRHLLGVGTEVALVATISTAVAANARVAGYADVTGFCREHGIPVVVLSDYALTPAQIGDDDLDLLVVNGWNRLISADVLARFRLGGIGIHAGHPPIGLGRAPLVWNILLGWKDIEVYVFSLTARADDGAIHARRTIEITPFDNARMLYEKVMQAGAELICESIDKIRRDVAPQLQLAEFARQYKKRTPEDGIVDFCQSEHEIYDFVRAQSSPYPGAFAWLGSEKWIFDRVVPFDRHAYRDRVRRPGEIVGALPSGLVVATGGSPIWILEARSGEVRKVPGDPYDLAALVGMVFRGASAQKTG